MLCECLLCSPQGEKSQTVGDKTTKILYFVVSMMPVVLQIIQWNMLRYAVAQCPAPKS